MLGWTDLTLRLLIGIITSSSIAGQRAYNKDVARLIRKHIQENPKEYGAQDTTSPEVDDELSGTPEPEEKLASAKSSTSIVSASGRPSGMFRSLVSSVQQNEAMATVLLVSNIALLAFFVIMLLTSGLPGRKVQVVKTVLNEEAERLALQRLLRMENSWKALQTCVDRMVKDSS